MIKERRELEAVREFLDRVDERAGTYRVDESSAWLSKYWNAAQAEYADMCKAVHELEAKAQE